MNNLTLEQEKPGTVAAATPESGICIYSDTSGKASDELESNLKTIRERQEVHKLMLAFIEEHRPTLAGLHWRVGYLDPEITISAGWYRGKKFDKWQVTELWPHAQWKRQKQKYGRDNAVDWITTVNGVTLRMEEAETVRPEPIKTSGPIPRRPRL